MNNYDEFLSSKSLRHPPCGIDADIADISDVLFPFQRQLVIWALRKGRSAIFADTGLGKTFMQLEWAKNIGRTLIFAPLSVAEQTIREAGKLSHDIDIVYSRGDDNPTAQIVITNYEMAEHFDPADFDAVVLDESSILKSVDGKTKRRLNQSFKNTKYKLCCTATPAPNDITELANHAEFLGVMTRAQMLATFFINNSSDKVHGGWKLKGHARESFYQWLASWGMSVKKPSDIGFSDDGYDLPEIDIRTNFVKTDYVPRGELFFTSLKGITERSAVRKHTMSARVARVVEIVRDSPSDSQWILWCGMNAESDALKKAMPEAHVLEGAQSHDHKAEVSRRFQEGEVRILITKPKISGFGMNFQNCHQMVFVGLSDSWEAYYQCIRRCWRFGQTSPVTADIVLSDAESAIYQNVMRKHSEAAAMSRELVQWVSEYEKEEIQSSMTDKEEYKKDTVEGDGFTLMLGDSCERLAEVETDSVGLSVFSPPFATLFSYSDSRRDLGNSKDYDEFFGQFRFIIQDLLRVTKPGRNLCCHCQQYPLTKIYDGVIGMRDFRGDLVRAFSSEGWTFHGEVAIDKCPQAQAIRTKAKGLMFATKSRDAVDLRPAYADYILVFSAPGKNAEPVKSDVTNDEWIAWARPIWYGIKETETLNFRGARDEKDEKHICPLQLETIERCIRLWSNRGDTILSPFAGIGSEGYVALQNERDFIGIELKESYFKVAEKNLAAATRRQVDMLDLINQAK